MGLGVSVGVLRQVPDAQRCWLLTAQSCNPCVELSCFPLLLFLLTLLPAYTEITPEYIVHMSVSQGLFLAKCKLKRHSRIIHSIARLRKGSEEQAWPTLAFLHSACALCLLWIEIWLLKLTGMFTLQSVMLTWDRFRWRVYLMGLAGSCWSLLSEGDGPDRDGCISPACFLRLSPASANLLLTLDWWGCPNLGILDYVSPTVSQNL